MHKGAGVHYWSCCTCRRSTGRALDPFSLLNYYTRAHPYLSFKLYYTNTSPPSHKHRPGATPSSSLSAALPLPPPWISLSGARPYFLLGVKRAHCSICYLGML